MLPTDRLNTSAFPLFDSVAFNIICPNTTGKQAIYVGSIPGVDLQGRLHFWSFFQWAAGNPPCRGAEKYTWVDETQMRLILERLEHSDVYNAAKAQMERTDFHIERASRLWIPGGSQAEFADVQLEELTWENLSTVGWTIVVGGTTYYFLSMLRAVPMAVPVP